VAYLGIGNLITIQNEFDFSTEIRNEFVSFIAYLLAVLKYEPRVGIVTGCVKAAANKQSKCAAPVA
jgi:hypothetical protein